MVTLVASEKEFEFLQVCLVALITPWITVVTLNMARMVMKLVSQMALLMLCMVIL